MASLIATFGLATGLEAQQAQDQEVRQELRTLVAERDGAPADRAVVADFLERDHVKQGAAERGLAHAVGDDPQGQQDPGGHQPELRNGDLGRDLLARGEVEEAEHRRRARSHHGHAQEDGNLRHQKEDRHAQGGPAGGAGSHDRGLRGRS